MFFAKHPAKTLVKKISLLLVMLLAGTAVWAEGGPLAPSSMNNPYVVTLVIIALLLALIIGLLANVVLGSATIYADNEKKQKAKEEKSAPVPAATVVSMIALLFVSSSLSAQETTSNTAPVVSKLMDGISPVAFYMLVGVIILELAIVVALLYNLRLLLNIQRKKKAVVAVADAKPRVSWWDRMNRFKPVEEEAAIVLDHNYDGIRELDNRLPPWWLYGFYCCILFAVIYLWRYHVSHSAPLSKEEYEIAVQEAAVQREAYLLKAANKVDETNVKQLTEAADLESGKRVFQTVCFACHGKSGEGGVGPNLTDDYWLHGGSISEVFKTIKYGWTEKGMKSWKDDYSPSQIAQIASYVKTLRGTNPPNGKAPQGVLYAEAAKQGTGADSTSTHKDSTVVKAGL